MKTVIAGREYNLKTDNEKLLSKASELVNTEINKLSEVLVGESQATVAVLTSLSLAERLLSMTEQNNYDKEYMRQELSRMSEQLDKQMNRGDRK